MMPLSKAVTGSRVAPAYAISCRAGLVVIVHAAGGLLAVCYVPQAQR